MKQFIEYLKRSQMKFKTFPDLTRKGLVVNLDIVPEGLEGRDVSPFPLELVCVFVGPEGGQFTLSGNGVVLDDDARISRAAWLDWINDSNSKSLWGHLFLRPNGDIEYLHSLLFTDFRDDLLDLYFQSVKNNVAGVLKELSSFIMVNRRSR
jgi:hypothetical protein